MYQAVGGSSKQNNAERESADILLMLDTPVHRNEGMALARRRERADDRSKRQSSRHQRRCGPRDLQARRLDRRERFRQEECALASRDSRAISSASIA
jgi:hypothetical protein